MRIAQISDVHFARWSWSPIRLLNKRALGMANWLGRRQKEWNLQARDQLPELFDLLRVDVVLVGGDLTNTSLPMEFKAAQNFFQRVRQPKIFIPGNHDQYTRGSYKQKRFYRFFSNERKLFGHPAEKFTLARDRVEAHFLKEGWWCVALDTAPAMPWSSSNGLFDIETEEKLEALLKLLDPQEKVILLNHFSFFSHDLPKHRLLRGEELRKCIERTPSIVLYLHGHTHRHTIADLRVNGLPVVLDSGCPIQRGRETWNLIDLEEAACHIHAYQQKDNQWEVFRRYTVHFEEPSPIDRSLVTKEV